MKKIYVFVLLIMVVFLGTNCNKQKTVMPDQATAYSSVKINENNSAFIGDGSSLAREEQPGCYGVEWNRGDAENLLHLCRHSGDYCSFFLGLCFKINNYREVVSPNPVPGKSAYRAILFVEDQNINAMINESVFLVDRFILPPTVDIPKHLVMRQQYLYYSAKEQGYPVILKEL